MSFLGSIFGGSKASIPVASQNFEDMDGFVITENNSARILAEIDIDAAISAHENWKLRLDTYVAGTSLEELRSEVVCLDDQCLLGKWLHGAGRSSLGHHPSFSMLIGRHKQFHIEASNVVVLTQSSQLAKAHAVLNGNYARASRQVIWMLKNLKNNLGFLTI